LHLQTGTSGRRTLRGGVNVRGHPVYTPNNPPTILQRSQVSAMKSDRYIIPARRSQSQSHSQSHYDSSIANP
jgi:hypothetical protein